MTLQEFENKYGVIGTQNVDLGGAEVVINGSNILLDFKGYWVNNGLLHLSGHYNKVKGMYSKGCGVRMDGTNNTVYGCVFYEMNQNWEAVMLYNKLDYSLAATKNLVSGCYFYGTSGGQGTVVLNGNGHKIEKCCFMTQSNPRPAIKLVGAKHVVYNNVIEYQLNPAADDDAGVISIGRNLNWPGSKIDGNHLIYLGGESTKVAGVYLDDGISNIEVCRNYIIGFPMGVKLGGGSFNNLWGNRIANCKAGIRMDARYAAGYLDGTFTKSTIDLIPRDSVMWARYGSKLKKWAYQPSGNKITQSFNYNPVKDSEFINCETNLKVVDLPTTNYGTNSIEGWTEATTPVVE